MTHRRVMTKQEAEALKRFKDYCTCGGFAWQMNGRKESSPHMEWCPQAKEYAEWWDAMNTAPQRAPIGWVETEMKRHRSNQNE